MIYKAFDQFKHALAWGALSRYDTVTYTWWHKQSRRQDSLFILYIIKDGGNSDRFICHLNINNENLEDVKKRLFNVHYLCHYLNVISERWKNLKKMLQKVDILWTFDKDVKLTSFGRVFAWWVSSHSYTKAQADILTRCSIAVHSNCYFDKSTAWVFKIKSVFLFYF